jgi:hypothetical protein
MRSTLALLQLASFSFSVWVAAFFYGLLNSDIRMRGTATLLEFSIIVAVIVTLLTRSYHLWKWSLPGPRVGSILLAVAHLGLIGGYLIYEEMRKSSQGSGLMLAPAVVWCGGLYPAGLLAVVISLLKEFSRRDPAAERPAA